MEVESRVIGLMEGDHNTLFFFFHKMASNRRHANVITNSMVGLSEDALI